MPGSLRACVLVLLLAALSAASAPFPPSLQAQPPTRALHVGQTVRFTLKAQAEPLEGRLAALGEEMWSVAVGDGTLRVVPSDEVQRAEVWEARNHGRRGIWIGLGAGTLLGVTAVACEDGPAPDPGCGVARAVTTVVGAGIGAGAGWLIGRLFDAGRWVPAARF